jgi:hypothetical protein
MSVTRRDLFESHDFHSLEEATATCIYSRRGTSPLSAKKESYTHTGQTQTQIYTHTKVASHRARCLNERERKKELQPAPRAHHAAAADNAPNRFQCAFSTMHVACATRALGASTQNQVARGAKRERIYMGGLGVFLLQGAALSALSAHYVCVTHARPFALFLARMSYRVSCTLLVI